MADIKTELFGVIEALTVAKIPYGLCGGLAVVLHGYPRATQDIDLLIRPEDCDRARAAVKDLGFQFEAAPMTFKAGQPDEQQIMRISKIVDDDALVLDFLLVSEYLDEVWANRQKFQIDGIEVVAIDRDGLIQMKRSSGRAKDLADIENLPT